MLHSDVYSRPFPTDQRWEVGSGLVEGAIELESFAWGVSRSLQPVYLTSGDLATCSFNNQRALTVHKALGVVDARVTQCVCVHSPVWEKHAQSCPSHTGKSRHRNGPGEEQFTPSERGGETPQRRTRLHPAETAQAGRPPP